MKTVLIYSTLLMVLTLKVIAEPLVTVERKRIIEICQDAIMSKYKEIQKTSIKFETLRYEELSGGDKILEVNFEVPLARKSDPKYSAKSSVKVVLLATGGLIRVDSQHERWEKLMKNARKAKEARLKKETEQQPAPYFK